MNTQLKIAGLAFLALISASRTALPQAPGEFKLKHRSSFTDPPAHNPFWPIGWVNSEHPQETVQEPLVAIKPESFVVSSISLGASPLAVIRAAADSTSGKTTSGKTYGEGDSIEAIYGGQRIRIQVVAIGDGAVTLQYAGKKIIVSMKHAESGPRQEPKANALKDNAIILH